MLAPGSLARPRLARLVWSSIITLLGATLARASVCGNGVVEAGEGCDDANGYSGDGCSADCVLEDAVGSQFLCVDVPMAGGGEVTQCCTARWNPVTVTYVCSCDGQDSGSPLYRLSPACEVLDIDECRTANGGCAPNALCYNLDGRLPGNAGFDCVCPPGLFGDGRERCETNLYGAMLGLAVRNLTEAGNFLTPEWIATKLWESGLIPPEQVSDVRASYDGHARHLLEASAYDHVTVVLQVASWDTMHELVDDVNAALLAEFLSVATGGLNQVSVVQETTTIVQQSLSQYTYTADTAPGFLVSNLSYAAVPTPASGWGPLEHVWQLAAHYYAPPGTYHVLFATRAHEGHAPAEHECAAATDVCCLHRMAADHLLGEFGQWVAANLSPQCTGPGGTPGPGIVDLDSAVVLAGLPRTRWVEGVFANFSNSSSAWRAPSELDIRVSQADVVRTLARERPFGGGAAYAFAVGMLFFNPLPSPALHAVVGQARFEVFGGGGVTFVATSHQDYSFLEYLDLTMYEIRYRTEAGELYPVRFVRVTLLLPQSIRVSDAVPGDSLQLAFGPDVAAVGPWMNPCYSSMNASARDGGGLWDSAEAGSTSATYAAAGAQECALGEYAFCSARRLDRTDLDSQLYTLDVPLGPSLSQEPYLFLRFTVQGERNATGEFAASVYEVITQVNAQLLVDESTTFVLCADAVASEIADTDFTTVSVAVGVEMQPTAGDSRDAVVFSDVTNTVDYAAMKALDTSKQYKAVSVIDSTLTVAVLGEPSFFEQPEHLAYEVTFDHVITVHVRSEPKFEALTALITADAAYDTVEEGAGVHSIVLREAFLAACYGPGLVPDPAPDENVDCVLQHPVSARVVDAALAHALAGDINEDVAWLVGLFGNSDFSFDTASTLATRSRERFGLDARYRRALWVVPTYPWPGRLALATSDRTILLLSFSVARN